MGPNVRPRPFTTFRKYALPAGFVPAHPSYSGIGQSAVKRDGRPIRFQPKIFQNRKIKSWLGRAIRSFLSDKSREFWFWSTSDAPKRTYRRLNMLKKHIKTELPVFLQRLIGQLTNSDFDSLYIHLVTVISDLEYKVFTNVVEHERRKAKASKRLSNRAQKRRARRLPEVEEIPTSLPSFEETLAMGRRAHGRHLRGEDSKESESKSSIRMTGPEVIQALGGQKAPFSPYSRRDARNPGWTFGFPKAR